MPFACIHIPHFILQAALRAEPELRAQPAGIVEGTPPLLTIVALNEKAAQLGLRLEMTKLQAEQIPGLQLRQRSAAHETAAHAALLDLALAFSPRIEDTAADTIALDLTGLVSLFGSLENLAQRLAARAAEFGFRANVGVASNPEAAQLAARGFSGVTLLAPEEEAQRLGSLPVSALHLSVEMRETLDRWGVRTCAALAALPVAQLSEAAPEAPPLVVGQFADLIALAAQKRDLGIKAALERDVRLVRCEDGRLEIALLPSATRTLVNDLSRKFSQWTGRRWMVVVSAESGEATVHAQSEARQVELKTGVRADPLVQAVLARWPGADIVDVRQGGAADTPDSDLAMPEPPPPDDGAAYGAEWQADDTDDDP